ncbi:MAG: hypothetical protein K2H91_08500 [Lachnospiraceae bacterium]|nr:hypothetical protein [Lachnospiraceae bacterium]
MKAAYDKAIADGKTKEEAYKAAYDKAIANNKSKAEAYKLAKEIYWEGQYGDRKPTVEIPDAQGMTRDQWKDAYRESRGANNLIYQAEKATGMSSREVYNKAGIGNYDNLQVIAIYEHGGDVYMDVNPTARRNRSTSTQPIGISVKNSINIDVKLSSGGRRMYDTQFNMHAEVGAMLQTKHTGGVGTLTVLGKKVCTSCTTNVRLIAAYQNLSNLTVNEWRTGNIYSFNGADGEFFSKPKGGVTWGSGKIN